MRDLTTPLLRACEHPTHAPARVREALRARRGNRALDACTRSGRTALELATAAPGTTWALGRSLANAEVAQLLRSAAAAFSVASPAASFALAPAAYRRYVMPELLLVLGKDLRAEGGRPGLPGYPASDVVPRILSFLDRDDAFDLGPRSGEHFCGHCGVSDAATKLTRCIGCKRVWYCSPAHQKAAWKAHKPACKKVKKKKKKKTGEKEDAV